MEIFRLFGSVMLHDEPAQTGLDNIDKKASGVGAKLGSMLGTAAKWGAGLAAGAGVAVGGMLAMASKTADAADAIDKLSERTGIGREELQRWKYAADQSGADVGKLEVGIKKLSDVMDGASNGSKENAASFAKLGISLNDLKTKSQEDIFGSVMSALADMPKGAERNALGNDLLGKSYTEMLPLLNAGASGMNELKSRADELGLVMSEKSVLANVKFGDSMDDVEASLGMVTANVSTAFLPVIQGLLDWVLAHMPQIQAVFQTVFGVVADVVTVVGKLLKDYLMPGLDALFKWIEPNIPAIKEIIEDALNTIKDLTDSVIKFIKVIWENYGEEIKLIITNIFEVIKAIVTTAMRIIKDIIKIATALISGDWKGAWEGIKTLVSDIWNGIGKIIDKYIEYIKSVLSLFGKVAKNILSEAFNGIKDIILGIWDGIINGIKSSINAVTGLINGMISSVTGAINTVINLANKLPGIDIKNVSAPKIPSFAVGTRYLPADMLIQAHEGEMIVPKSENPYANSDGNITNSTPKTPTIFQLVLQNGKIIAEYIVDDLGNIIGNKNKLTERSVGV